MRREPFFVMSERERQESHLKGAMYELHIVYGIDPMLDTFTGMLCVAGEVREESHGLRPLQWLGRPPLVE